MNIIQNYLKRKCHAIFDAFRPIQLHGSNNVINKKSNPGNHFNLRVCGNNNTIEIGENCLLTNTDISIQGSNNRLIVDNQVRFMGPCKIVMLGNATLHIKWNAGIRGVDFTVIDGKVEVGELCMFSYNIVVRNTDSHKVIDLESGKVTNPSRDVILGRHVWICQNSSILKGCDIGDDSIVALGAVATKGCPPNSIIAGNPGKIVKQGITWDY